MQIFMWKIFQNSSYYQNLNQIICILDLNLKSTLLNRCLLSIYTLCEVFTSKAVQISPQNVCLGWQSRVMHQNVQIRAKGHFLPQFVKHNSNNNNEVWFYKERGRLDMLVWFPAQEKRAKARAHRMDSGQMKGLSECWGSLIGSP